MLGGTAVAPGVADGGPLDPLVGGGNGTVVGATGRTPAEGTSIRRTVGAPQRPPRGPPGRLPRFGSRSRGIRRIWLAPAGCHQSSTVALMAGASGPSHGAQKPRPRTLSA